MEARSVVEAQEGEHEQPTVGSEAQQGGEQEQPTVSSEAQQGAQAEATAAMGEAQEGEPEQPTMGSEAQQGAQAKPSGTNDDAQRQTRVENNRRTQTRGVIYDYAAIAGTKGSGKRAESDHEVLPRSRKRQRINYTNFDRMGWGTSE
ncbi:hypothetical protein CYMTET_17422 [Cymbomonas tetramitiformis]|uniref:Uncharacterized protein n=1 Tax=Cymbomonas tetramitiformis TaxID=36881 RepID=A0AAE0GAP8_9CHLO|nr:hypothetical protein CYMTET_17422 [Cymbomonas tetramitiformis]